MKAFDPLAKIYGKCPECKSYDSKRLPSVDNLRGPGYVVLEAGPEYRKCNICEHVWQN